MKFGTIDKFILFGGGDLLFQVAEKLQAARRHTVVLSSPRHLDETLPFAGTTLEQALKARAIPYLRVNDIHRDKKAAAVFDWTAFGIAFGAAWMFEKAIVEKFHGRLVDFMGIPLPRYRGGAHFSWQILRGDRSWACHVQLIEGGAETFQKGPLLKSKEYTLPAGCRIPRDCFDAMNQEALPFMLEFIEDLKAGREFSVQPLNESGNSFFPFLNTLRQGYIDWSWSAAEIERFICAFDAPYAGSSTFLDGKRVFLKGCSGPTPEAGHPFMAGLIIRKTPTAIVVAAKDGTLEITSISDPAGNALRSDLAVGRRFHTPPDVLSRAKEMHAAYDAHGLQPARDRRR
jgi:methionyl-tRNA formyltransferase